MSRSPSNSPSTTASGKSRNIVILLDGTSNQFSAKNSNVIKLLTVLQADEDQLIYYSSGLGTVLPESAGAWGKLKQSAAELTDMALAWNFDDFVMEAYRYLMDHYQSGDKVYIFGFSRGAYTARALCGMIQKVGLLPAGNYNQIKLAYEVYTSKEQKTKTTTQVDLSARYRRTFGISRTVIIQFIGVWDTVSSIGGLDLPSLPFASGVKSVRFFRQALALDERRARFAPEYRRIDPHEKTFDSPSDDLDHHSTMCANGQVVEVKKNKECWFMGCHSDVGGGNDENDEDSLSNVPFRWMLREAELCGLQIDVQGIVLQPAIYECPAVKASGLIPTRLHDILRGELKGDLVEADYAREVANIIKANGLDEAKVHRILEIAAANDTDMQAGNPAGAPIDDDIKRLPMESLTPAWFPVEALILQTRSYAGPKYEEENVWKMNLGQGRQIPPTHFIHRSVQKRLRYDTPLDGKPVHNGKKYGFPKAKLPDPWKMTWDQLRKDTNSKVWED